MKYKILSAAAITLLLVGCGNAEALKESKTAEISETVQSISVTSKTVTTVTTPVSKTINTETKAKTKSTVTTAKTAEKTEQASVTEEEHELNRTQHSSASKTVKKTADTEKSQTTPEIHRTVVTEAVQPVTEAVELYDSFYGVLIDQDCSDFKDPPAHDLPCMLMDECRASGYGVDILQSDGSWVFYMFDERGQELAWDYLRHTSRMDGLYVSVTGKWENNVIKVIDLNEV